MLDNIVDVLLQNLMELMPFVVVHSYEEGVRWTLGRHPKKLGPGFHLRVWLLHSCMVMSVVDDAFILPVQSVITKDEKLVCFRTSIAFRINDIVSHCCNVTDFIESTKSLAMQHLAKRVRDKTKDELVQDLDDLEKSLKGTLTTRFKEWGTEVFSVGFVDFAEVRHQMRLFQDQKDELL